jgi:hypothetical protein
MPKAIPFHNKLYWPANSANLNPIQGRLCVGLLRMERTVSDKHQNNHSAVSWSAMREPTRDGLTKDSLVNISHFNRPLHFDSISLFQKDSLFWTPFDSFFDSRSVQFVMFTVLEIQRRLSSV